MLALLLAAPALAEDVLDWTPPDAAVVAVSRVSPSALIDPLEARFGDVPKVKQAATRLKALLSLGGDLSPERGVAVFMTAPSAGRLVVGADDAKRAAARIATLLAYFDGDSRAEGATLYADGEPLTCASRGKLVVCDTGPSAPPEKAPGRPPWLAEGKVPTDGLGLLVIRGKAVEELSRGGGPPVTEVRGAVTGGEGGLEVVADVTLNPMAMGPFAMMVAEGGATPGLATADARSAAVMKVAFDGPKLLGWIDGMAGGDMPPPVKPLWDALKAAWTGELVVSTPGGLIHPVVSVGLSDDAAGRKLLEQVVSLASEIDPSVTLALKPGEKGVERLEVTLRDGEELALHLAFPFAIRDQRLVLGLHPPDVLRVVEGRVKPAKLPDTFAQRGTHGVVLWDPFAFFAGAWGFETRADGDAQLFLDAQTLGSLWALLLEEAGLSWRVTNTGFTARAWWRTL